MALKFEPATREAVYARICMHGPGGSGKTYTALTAMKALCGDKPFGVIDTEKGRAKKYLGINGWQWATVTPQSFSPESLTEQLGEAAGAGLAGIIIDSGSKYWNGVDGMLEQVDKRGANNARNDKFGGGWKEMAPVEQRMWDAILSYPGHVIMTLRVTSAYVVEEKERGGRMVSTPRKVGLKPVQRDTFEYEFDLVLECDQDNVFTVSKSDILLVPQGTVVTKPGPAFFDTIREFCAEGVEATSSTTYRAQALDPQTTRGMLRELMDRVESAGLKHSPVVDELDRPTVLGDLILSRARALKAAEEQAARETARPAQQPATQPQPPVTPPPVTPPPAPAAAAVPPQQQAAAPAANPAPKPQPPQQRPGSGSNGPATTSQRKQITNHIVVAGINADFVMPAVSGLIDRAVADWDNVSAAEATLAFNKLRAWLKDGVIQDKLFDLLGPADETELAPAS